MQGSRPVTRTAHPLSVSVPEWHAAISQRNNTADNGFTPRFAQLDKKVS